jgi:hypothetical protein
LTEGLISSSGGGVLWWGGQQHDITSVSISCLPGLRICSREMVGNFALPSDDHGGLFMIGAVWQRVKRGDIEAIHVRNGRKKGLCLKLNSSQSDLFNKAS